MRRWFSLLLMIALTIGGVGVLASLGGLRNGPAFAPESPSAVTTVRAYYAAVNHYIATGETDAIHDVIDADMLGAREDSRLACAAPSLLSALRRTYPQMRLTIDDLFRDGSTVVAQVSVDTGLAVSFDSVGLLPMENRWVTEMFTVADGRIVNCASYGPGQALVATMHRFTSVPSAPGALVIARISFSRDAQDVLSIPAPAIVSVEHGTLATPGNGVSVLSGMSGQQVETTDPGRTYVLTPGDEVTVSAGRVVLHNPNEDPASVLVTMIVPYGSDMGEAEATSPVQRLFERLAAPGGGVVGRGIWARTLVRSVAPIGTGPSELTTTSIVLTPGGSATIKDASTDLLHIPLTGDPLIERIGSVLTIRNPGSDQVLIQFAWAGDSGAP